MKSLLPWILIMSLALGLGACAGTVPSGGVSAKDEPTRFAAASEGIIRDSQTGLEWIAGPDRDVDYERAVQWVAACRTAGGGWRMPTRYELKTLYHPGLGKRNLDPVFNTTGWWVWAESRDSQTAWSFSFNHGCITSDARAYSRYGRVFAVRSLVR